MYKFLLGTRKLAQQLRALAALAEDLSLVPSNLMAAHSHRYQACTLHACRQNTHTHNSKNVPAVDRQHIQSLFLTITLKFLLELSVLVTSLLP